MYPAIDLFTGEKERGTIETLLTVPVSRWKILMGKMLVVVCSGMVAATCALLGLFVSIEFLDLADNKELLEVIHSILTPYFITFDVCTPFAARDFLRRTHDPDCDLCQEF